METFHLMRHFTTSAHFTHPHRCCCGGAKSREKILRHPEDARYTDVVAAGAKLSHTVDKFEIATPIPDGCVTVAIPASFTGGEPGEPVQTYTHLVPCEAPKKRPLD